MIVWWQYGTSLVVRWFFDTSSTVVRYYGDQLSTPNRFKSTKHEIYSWRAVTSISAHGSPSLPLFLILDAKVLIFSGNSKAFCRFFAQKRLKGMNFDDFLKNSSKAEKIFFSLFLNFSCLFQGKSLSLQHRLVSPIEGRRAVLYMRKTFSDVCLCGTRISQIPNPHS